MIMYRSPVSLFRWVAKSKSPNLRMRLITPRKKGKLIDRTVDPVEELRVAYQNLIQIQKTIHAYASV